jgi:hypothetical protein
MTTLIVGSQAIRHWFPDFPREPKDSDVWTGEPLTDRTGVDYFWDDRLAGLIGVRNDWYATPDELLSIKISHSPWELNNGSWRKHMHDIVWLQDHGAKEIPGWVEVLYPIWAEKHGAKKVQLNQESGAFFTDAVTRIYDHDSLHETVSHYDRPLWESVLRDGQSVAMDMKKVWALSPEDQIMLFREEVYATALERWLVPAWVKGQQFSPTLAYMWALRKTITSLTKGQSSLFMIRNYRRFRECPRLPDGRTWYMVRHEHMKHLLRPYEGNVMM